MKKWVGLLAIVLSGCAQQPPVEETERRETTLAQHDWKLITTWPKNLPALGRVPERFAELVDSMSSGQLKIKVYGAGELVPALEVFDSVSQGAAELGHGAAYYWRGKMPVAPIFTTVPFGMNAQEMNAWLHYGGGLELWQEMYAPFELLPMAAGNSGVQMAGWFNKEVNSIEDLAGLKMRIPGLGGEVFNRAGGIAVLLPGSEIYTSLEKGAIDATEWVGPLNDRAFALHEIGTYYYYPGWHEPGATLELIVNLDAWAELTPNLQTIVTTAARALNQDMLDELTARNAEALQNLVAEHGVQIRELPPDVLTVLREHSNAVLAELAGDEPLAQRIVASYVDFLARVRAYHAITEDAYLQARTQK